MHIGIDHEIARPEPQHFSGDRADPIHDVTLDENPCGRPVRPDGDDFHAFRVRGGYHLDTEPWLMGGKPRVRGPCHCDHHQCSCEGVQRRAYFGALALRSNGRGSIHGTKQQN